MASKLPEWFVIAINKEQVQDLPDWFKRAIGEEQTVAEMPEEMVNRADSRGRQEGNFTTTMMAEIRSHESPNHGYNDYFGRGFSRGPVAPPKSLTEMTVNEVSAWQVASNPPGNDTSAAGAYQIINRTLKDLIRTMNLTGDELFSLDLQDQMAVTLMKRRGLDRFLSGKIDGATFAAGMAREWASLPVLKPDRRGGREISVGQSYYTGDGVNKAFQGKKQLEEYRELYALVDPSSL